MGRGPGRFFEIISVICQNATPTGLVRARQCPVAATTAPRETVNVVGLEPGSCVFPQSGFPSLWAFDRRSTLRGSQTTIDSSKPRSQIIAQVQAMVRTTPNRIVAIRQGTPCASRRNAPVATPARPGEGSTTCTTEGSAGSEPASEDGHAVLTPLPQMKDDPRFAATRSCRAARSKSKPQVFIERFGATTMLRHRRR